jgi:hypothetical protein
MEVLGWLAAEFLQPWRAPNRSNDVKTNLLAESSEFLRQASADRHSGRATVKCVSA